MPTKKPNKTASAVVTCRQAMSGPSWGEHGIAAYHIVGDKMPGDSMYGLPLYKILPEAFNDGARVRVTVELLKAAPLKVNESWVAEDKRSRARQAALKRKAR